MLKTGKLETVFENGFKSSGILSIHGKQSTVGPYDSIPSHSMTTPLCSHMLSLVSGVVGKTVSIEDHYYLGKRRVC
jgi:hypothetical protein